MSSDLFLFDGSFFRNSSSDNVPSDVDLQFLSEPFFPFPDPSSDILQAFSGDPNQQFPADPSHSGDQTAVNLLSCSPPSHKLNSLSLSPTTQFQSLPINVNSSDGLTSLSVLDSFGVKSDECYVKLDSSPNPSLLSNSYDSKSAEKLAGMMQRSFSSKSLDQKPGFFFQPRFESLQESPNFQIQGVGSSENSNCTVPMRRVCSTGDLQRFIRTQSTYGFSSSPLAAENPFTEEASFKVRRYSAEERKQRIHRYRSKRTQRNFNKTIKYACRKTLADSRPRVRGRFARNDETGEIPKGSCFNQEKEDEDELGVDGFHEEAMMREGGGGGFLNGFIPTQFQYYGF